MPCSGLRNSAPERKPSALQCQNVQNQTKRIAVSERQPVQFLLGVGRRMNRNGIGSVTLTDSHAVTSSLGNSTSTRYSPSPERSAYAESKGCNPFSETKVISNTRSCRGTGAS